jgi:hypothetical protein
MWIGEVKKGGKRGQRFNVEAVEWTSEGAHLHVEPTNEKIAKNEMIQTRVVKKMPGESRT